MDYLSAIKNDDNINSALQNAKKSITETITEPFLPNPFVPGSTEYFREQYYWDSFFIMQGLNEMGDQGIKIIKGMVENFFALFKRYGLIPNSSNSFTTRSQPPFLSSMILLVDKRLDDKKWLERSYTIVRNEYKSVWTSPLHLTITGLSRYRDLLSLNGKAIDAENESGWDLTPRFRSNTNHVCPVDLNALIYKYEKDFEMIANKLGDVELAMKWEKRSETRIDLINKYCWNEKEGFYFDFDTDKKEMLDTKTLAAYVTMWAGCADKKHAQRLVKKLKIFEHEGGLSATDQDYESSQQWSFPNGWPPLMWLVISGLQNYGFKKEAERLTYKWLKLCADEFINTGEWHEKYCVVKNAKRHDDKRYPHQTWQFWTMGIFISLYNKILDSSHKN